MVQGNCERVIRSKALQHIFSKRFQIRNNKPNRKKDATVFDLPDWKRIQGNPGLSYSLGFSNGLI